MLSFLRFLSIFILSIITCWLSGQVFANETYTKTVHCPSKSREFIKYYQINEEKVFFSLCDGTVVNPPKAKNQEGVGSLKLSKDNKWIGWAVDVPNCCTSYPIPAFLNIYHKDKIYTVNSDGQMIWSWYFSDENGKVILEQGTTHGMTEPNIDEYDIKTSKKIRHIKDGN